jgi:hypothetical protein
MKFIFRAHKLTPSEKTDLGRVDDEIAQLTWSILAAEAVEAVDPATVDVQPGGGSMLAILK